MAGSFESPTLSTFEKACPLEGPPSEWLHGGISRRAYVKELKGKMAGWDKEWARLAGKELISRLLLVVVHMQGCLLRGLLIGITSSQAMIMYL
jgi:hypothetical protein